MRATPTRRWSLQELLTALDVEDGSAVAEDVECVLIKLTNQKAVLVNAATGSFRLASTDTAVDAAVDAPDTPAGAPLTADATEDVPTLIGAPMPVAEDAPTPATVKPSYLVQHGATFEGFTELDEAAARFSTVPGAKLWRRLKLRIKVGPGA
jgi:hypothetical protein